MKRQSKLESILTQVRGNRKTRRITSVLACLVVLVTLWRLTLPAITLEWGKPQAEGITEPEAADETLQEEELLTEETLSDEVSEEEEPLLRWATLKEAEEAGYPDAVRVDRLICGQKESEEHRHSSACIESYYMPQSASFAEEAFLAMPAQRFEGEAGSLSVRVDAAEGTFPEETEMALTEADAAEVRRAAAGLVNGRISQVLAVDIGFLYEGEKIEPEQPVQVVLSGSALKELKNPVVLHIDGEGNAEIVSHRTADEAAPAPRLRMAARSVQPEETLTETTDETAENTEGLTEETLSEEVPEETIAEESLTDREELPKGALVFEAKEFSVYAVVTTIETTYITADGETYGIKVTCGEDAGIPEGAELAVRELPEEEYADYRAKTAEALGCRENAIDYLKLLDISIVKDGEPIQPQAKVDVEIRLLDKVQSEGKEETSRVVHFGEEAEELACAEETIEEMPAVTFKTDAFSVYAVMYTVDFHYEVDGKVFEFSLPGGGYLSFRELVTALEIAKDDPETEENELDAFLADVQDVAFSSPELVSVSKVEEDTTVGAVKDALGLACEYSAELTEEDIKKINAATVSAGDWALISLKPFDTEESLTVTMANGEVFTVKVTDAQISTHVITADGKDYTITVTYGPEAGIPDGAELVARELLPETEEYEAYYIQMIATIEGEASDLNLDDELDAVFADFGLEVVNPQSAVDVAFVRFFDISIWKDDMEIEPLAPVQVEIQYTDPVSVDSNAEAEVIHFAEDSIELIDPATDLNESSGEGISSFTYQQSSFSISATLLKYTSSIQNGNYVIIKGAKVNNEDHYYALKADGSTVEVTKNGDTFTNTSNNADDAFWTFTSAGNGQYNIQNRSNWQNRLVLYNNIVGNWDQLINVEAPDGRKTVYLRNPNNTPLRFNGNTRQFVLGKQNDNADQFFLARMTSEIPIGQGYNLTPAGETDLGELYAIRNKINNSKIITDKTAAVHDYENRIYQVDLKALSDVTIFLNKVDLELIVDTSRSMYFPANLSPVSGYYFTSIMGNDSHSLESQLSWLDKNQIYYFIGNGEQATVYALYYAASGANLNDHTGEQCWKYVDASYMNPPDAGAMNQSDRLNRLVGARIDDLAYSICNQNRNGGGCRLYSASSSITRLAYLKEAVRIASEIVYAVDHNNRIGLVTFNSKANNPRFYEYASRNGLYSAINNISLAGGTRQDLGLEAGKNLFDNSGRTDAQKIAILITDGAPNMKYDNGTQVPSDTAWSWIAADANDLKGTNSSDAKLYTLGLSLDMVGGNNERNLNALASEEDHVTRHFNADNGPQIVTAVKQLIETLVYDATLEAEVTDVVDPAFYPVDENGNPIEPGTYRDTDGTEYTWTKEMTDGAECWKITYKSQKIERGEKNSDGTIKTPGWNKSFYIKAKEDFLGGNSIETNKYYKSNNHVKPEKYVYIEKGTGIEKKVDAPANAPWGKFENTPYVNVDELTLDQHNTEWTVYLGTEVSPLDQMKELYRSIKVYEVVSAEDEDHRRSDGSKMKTEEGFTANTFPLTDVTGELTEPQWTELTTNGTLTLPYTPYDSSRYGTDHVGSLVITLTKSDKGNYEPHSTTETGKPVETYTLKVGYQPSDVVTELDYHTTPGGQPGYPTNQMTSENTHKINVFAKALHITKTDVDFNKVLTGAKFVLYRTKRATDTDSSKVKTLPGISGEYYPAAELVCTDGTATLDPVEKLEAGESCYLVETAAPEGYMMLTTPIPVTLSIQNTYIQPEGSIKPEDRVENKPAEGLYDWVQEATLGLGISGSVKRTDSANSQDLTHDALVYNSEKETMYYRIANNPGAALPSTGGPGTRAFSLAGLALTLLALAGLAGKRKSRA